jgi:hypothetical protein
MIAAALWAGFAARIGAAWDLPASLVLSAGVVTLTVVDLRHQRLPRRIVFPVGPASVALLGVAATPPTAAITSSGPWPAPPARTSRLASSDSCTRGRSAVVT